ncbi:MAG: hypothetical protein GXO64_01485 [Candidatus Micrarchaeota archaeon]|nr:hypothetical protein [Candidatus Micrarchaeota archaeon]
MSQKNYINYKIEIVRNLLKGENHIRGLAADMGTNQTTISRKIRELESENVVDYKYEGRNKVHFLKKNIESLHYAFICERFVLLETLRKYPLLRRIIREIINEKRIKLAILFGSYAKHTAHKESDIDIYLETKDRTIKRRISLVDGRLSIKTGRYDRKGILIREIEKNHVIIKGVERFYEKIKFLG